MAQARREEKIAESLEEDGKDNNASGSSSSFKFNAQAPEFVPRSHALAQTIASPAQISSYYYPCFEILGGAGASDWLYVGNQDPSFLVANTNVTLPNSSKNILTDDLQHKIVKQVEYQFSDMSLLANETLMKQMNKDPESYVPISLVASTKKIKSLVSNNQMLVQALLSSSKLVVSDDGKKVKRKYPFTEIDKEELQTRTVVAENLPEDHSYPNLQKIFSAVGSVKNIRVCQPQESNVSRPKGEVFIINKLHALVQYESPDLAEKAVEKFNDEWSWRKGMRIRACSDARQDSELKSVLKNKKAEFDSIIDGNDPQSPESAEDSSQLCNTSSLLEDNGEENSGTSKKGWSRGRGKGRGRGQSYGGRGLLALIPQTSSPLLTEATCKQNTKGPRMPDGTRGFTMGRGRSISNPVLAAGSLQE